MKKILFTIAFICTLVCFISCEKDEGNLPNISLKSGGTYISSDATKNPKESITIGINASKAEKKDVLKKFNISKSINGAASTSVLDKDLSGSEEDNFDFDFNTMADSTSGQKSKYIFTVTNRDGLTNQVSVTITTK